jgi:aprataxin
VGGGVVCVWGAGVRVGGYSAPSMLPLHLHLISADLDSAALKTKDHWNSFQPPFLRDSAAAAAALEAAGAAGAAWVGQAEAKGWLKADLRCHRCGGGGAADSWGRGGEGGTRGE